MMRQYGDMAGALAGQHLRHKIQANDPRAAGMNMQQIGQYFGPKGGFNRSAYQAAQNVPQTPTLAPPLTPPAPDLSIPGGEMPTPASPAPQLPRHAGHMFSRMNPGVSAGDARRGMNRSLGIAPMPPSQGGGNRRGGFR